MHTRDHHPNTPKVLTRSEGGQMERTDYVTTFPRALLALVVGIVVGTLAFLLELALLLAIRPSKLEEMAEYVGMANSDLILTIAIAVVIFFAGGLVIVGTPIWWILHRLGRRQ